jgi:hypothetical protein
LRFKLAHSVLRGPLSPLDQPQQEEQDNGANRRNNQTAEYVTASRQPKRAEWKTDKQCTNHTHNDVPNDTKTATLHELARQPSGKPDQSRRTTPTRYASSFSRKTHSGDFSTPRIMKSHALEDS